MVQSSKIIDWILSLVRDGGSSSTVNSAINGALGSARDSNVKSFVECLADTLTDSGISGDSERGWLQGLLTNSGYEAELNRLFNSAEAAKQRDWQSNENAIARDFQLMMSNTAYQRSMDDMRSAGLNPILAYSQGGAANSAYTSGSSASGSYQGVSGSDIGSLASGFGSMAKGVGDLLKYIIPILTKRV